MPRQRSTASPSNNTIPSLQLMEARFQERLRQYVGQPTIPQQSSRESTVEATVEATGDEPGKRKRKNRSVDEGEAEQGEPSGIEPKKRLTITIRGLQSYSTDNDNTTPTTQASANTTKGQRISMRIQEKTNTSQANSSLGTKPACRTRSRPPTSATTTSKPKPKPEPPRCPHLKLENEPKEIWKPVRPGRYLRGDTEGPQAAWKRLFPNEGELGEYMGGPAMWMKRMRWNGVEWEERIEAIHGPYVERYLGRVPYGHGNGGRGGSMRFCSSVS